MLQKSSLTVRLSRHIVLISACVFAMAPIIFLVLNSFKTLDGFFAAPYGLPHGWHISNYVKAWQTAGVARGVLNSTIATVGGLVINLAVAIPASYGFARYASRASVSFYRLFVGGMVVPLQLVLLPLLITTKQLHIGGTIWGLAFVYAGLTLPMSILFLTSAFNAIPKEIDEAARLDGAGTFTLVARIIVPLSRPVIVAVIILTGVWIWNDFTVALILASKPSIYTLPVAIMSFFGEYSTEWTLAFASVVVSALPLMIGYLLFTRQFISGLAAGAVKG